MKILFVYAHYSHGGCETVLYNRKKALEKAGATCHLLFTAPPTTRVFRADRGIFFTSDPTLITSLIRTNRYDLISVLDTPAFFPHLARYAGAVINECHTSDTDYLAYIKTLSPSPDAFITPAGHLADYLRGKVAAPVQVIPNALDLAMFQPLVHPARPVPAPPPGRKILGWVGRLEGAKNPLEFLHLVREVKKTRTDLSAWILSGHYAPLLRKVKREAQYLGLQNDLTIRIGTPYHQMPAVYSLMADSGGCLVATSERECYPMVLLEAAISRCPIVATDIPGHRETITPGVNGRLYPIRDLAAGTREIVALLADETERSALTEGAAANVRLRNAPDRIAREMLAIFAAVIARKTTDRPQ